MRIACPACNAAYQVPDAQMREGRVVRCARCGTDWTPKVDIPADDPVEPPHEPEPPVVDAVREPEPAAEHRRMALDDDMPVPAPAPVAPMLPPAAQPRRGLPLLAIAWVVSLAIVGGAVGALVVKRDQVMAAWPPSIRGYAAVGLAATH